MTQNSEETQVDLSSIEPLLVERTNENKEDVEFTFQPLISPKLKKMYFGIKKVEGWENDIERFIGRAKLFEDFVYPKVTQLLQGLFNVAESDAVKDGIVDEGTLRSGLKKLISQLSKRGETIKELQNNLYEIIGSITKLQREFVLGNDGLPDLTMQKNIQVQQEIFRLTANAGEIADAIERKKSSKDTTPENEEE